MRAAVDIAKCHVLTRLWCGLMVCLFFSVNCAYGQREEASVDAEANTHILFVFDASNSMNAYWEGKRKIEVATSLLSESLSSLYGIPGLKLGLRVYGHQTKFIQGEQDCDDTELVVPLAEGNNLLIQKALGRIQARGTTPIARSLERTAEDFPAEDARKVIVLITDGIEACDEDPCAVSRMLQEEGIVVKPFIIGIGLEEEYKDTFRCVGNFFDPGGATGNYGSNDLYTMTFCSDTPGEQIVFDFLTFDVESGWDDLVIYDGSNTSSPVIGTFTGTNGPGTVESTNGCLTFVWDSDGSVNYSGWAASISCYAPSCSDGIQNQGETGIDCGGPCTPCPSCTDGIQNGDETGVDCGGSCPEPCHCGNGILDGDETDVDCGGSCYPCPIECSVDLTYELDGSGSMVFPGGVDYLISNGTINTCGGTFFDTGGPTSEYGNFEYYEMTFCSDDPDPNAQIVFDFQKSPHQGFFQFHHH